MTNSIVREAWIEIRLWSKQTEVMGALEAPGSWVAVRGGHKTGKTFVAEMATAGLSRVGDSRIFVVCPTMSQTHALLERASILAGPAWPKRKYNVQSAPAIRAADAIAGPVDDVPTLFVLDAAHDLKPDILDAIRGRGVETDRVLLLGIPTLSCKESALHQAFHQDDWRWNRVWISAEEVPNVVSGKREIPGLAIRAWVEEKRQEWGATSDLYRTRVLGQFVE